MRILLVGNTALAEPLAELGHEVLLAQDAWPDAYHAGAPLDLAALWDRLPRRPDALLVADALAVDAIAVGLEHVPVPRLYYSIDTHLNFFWQRHYGRLFDLVFTAHREYVPRFEALGVPAHWLPWGAAAAFRDLGLPRDRDLVFIGTLDGTARAKRAGLVALLRRRYGLATFGETVAERLSWAEMARVMSAAKVVLNESICGELNFRVFEAMACGALLLTEHADTGLLDLFTPGEHLVTYTPETLCAQVERCLAAGAERARIAAAGARLVHARHTLRARMEELAARLAGGVARRDVGCGAAPHLGLAIHLMVAAGRADPATMLPRAAENLRTAVLEERDAEAAVALAELLVAVGRLEGALGLLAVARGLDPGRIEAWFLAAQIERRRGHAARAADLFRGGVDAAPGASAAVRARARAALVRDPGSSPCLHALGAVLEEAGRGCWPGFVRRHGDALPRTAIDYYTHAVQADVCNVAAADDAATLLERLRMPDQGLLFREHAARHAPGDATTRAKLAQARRRCYRLEVPIA